MIFFPILHIGLALVGLLCFYSLALGLLRAYSYYAYSCSQLPPAVGVFLRFLTQFLINLQIEAHKKI